MFSRSYNGRNKKIFWQEFWRHELEEALRHAPVVIIPVGSVEQHGPHCPMDVDISIPYHLAAEVATGVNEYPIIVAPPVWTGFTHFNMGHVGTITVTLETYICVLCDVCRSIKANGFERMILLNGHGGNIAPTQATSVKLAQEDVWALHISYFHMVQDEMKAWGESDSSIGHGGEWETSLQLHLREHLIAMDRRAPNGLTSWFSSAELERFAKWPERRREADEGVMGDPFKSSAEKGQRLFNAAVDKLVKGCNELHEKPVRSYFERGSHCTLGPV